jgi:hypothetical protein
MILYSILFYFITFNYHYTTITTATIVIVIIKGNLEVKFPKIWIDDKQRWEELESREK